MAKSNRRGKNEKSESSTTTTTAASTTTPPPTSSTTNTATTNSPEEQIARAQAAVEKSRHSAATLHDQWRLHLLRLSYMSYNKSLTPLDDDNMRISGWRAIFYVINDTLCEFLAVIMGICLTIFLTQMHSAGAVRLVNTDTNNLLMQQRQSSSFYTDIAYMISTGLVPPVLNFYFHHSKPNVSCLDHSSVTNVADRMWTRHTEHEDSLASAVRGFPVVIIFHTIATGCCWFMDMQQAQQNRNIIMLENLKKDLANARKEHANNKKKS